jgi:hypothetical protein
MMTSCQLQIRECWRKLMVRQNCKSFLVQATDCVMILVQWLCCSAGSIVSALSQQCS